MRRQSVPGSFPERKEPERGYERISALQEIHKNRRVSECMLVRNRTEIIIDGESQSKGRFSQISVVLSFATIRLGMIREMFPRGRLMRGGTQVRGKYTEKSAMLAGKRMSVLLRYQKRMDISAP